MSGLSPQAARKMADEQEASGDEASARLLRKWALRTGQAKRRSAAGLEGDAEESWERAESHRQALADRGVVVPSRSDLEAPPEAAPARKSPGGSPGGASSSGGSRRPRVSSGGSRSRSRSGSIRRSPIARATGIPQAASRAGSSAGTWTGAIVVGSLLLILLFRLVDEKSGGPSIVQWAAAGATRLTNLIVLPVDPFASGSSSKPANTAPASSSSSAAAPNNSTPTK